MEKHSVVNLFLDKDNLGIKATWKAVLSSPVYKDQSILYEGFKDLNDRLISNGLIIKQGHGLKQSFKVSVVL